MKTIRSFLFPFFLVLLVIFSMAKLSWFSPEGEPNRAIISGDGVGYYQYLVSLFLEKDIDHQELKGAFMKPVGDRVVNKCFVGTAIGMSPFFAIGCLHHFLIGEQVEPYSLIMQRWINIGSIVYLLLAFFFLYQWLSSFNFKRTYIYLVLVCLLMGTNLFLYSILSPSMTHVYSFFSVTAFLHFARQFLIKSSISSGYYSTIFLAWLILIRPSNGIVLVLLPFLAGGIAPLFERIKTLKPSQFVWMVLLGGAVLFIQAFLWYLQSGNWLVWSYGEEGFYWSNPQFYEVLFGFRKGWFIYTPIALLAMLGLWPQFKKDKTSFFYLFGFLLLLVYVTASWWSWSYGASFGQRPFVDFYAIIAYLLILYLQQIKRKSTQLILFVLLLAFMFLNLVQSYQYKENLISSWDMTFEKYKATFLVTEVEQVKIGGNREFLPYQVNKAIQLDTLIDFQSNVAVQTTADSISKRTVVDYSDREYNLALKYQPKHKGEDIRGNYLEIELARLEKSLNSSEDAKVIIGLKDSLQQDYYYYWFLMNEVPSQQYNQWKSYQYQVLLPPLKSNNDELIVFIRNEDKTAFYVNDFKVRLSSLE